MTKERNLENTTNKVIVRMKQVELNLDCWSTKTNGGKATKGCDAALDSWNEPTVGFLEDLIEEFGFKSVTVEVDPYKNKKMPQFRIKIIVD